MLSVKMMKEGKQEDLFAVWGKDAKSDTPNADSENIKFLVLLDVETSPSSLAVNSSVAIAAT
jgi:hypothetical protein